MTDQVCGRSVRGTSIVILILNASGSGNGSTGGGSNDSLSSGLIGRCIDHLDGFSCGWVWKKRNGHGGTMLAGKNIL